MYGYSSTNTRMQEYRPKDKDQPLDTVSCIIWDPYRSDPSFIVSSWDGFVRYYMLRSGQGNSNSLQIEKVWSMFLQHPVLCCDINDSGILFVGMSTGDIAAINLSTSDVVRLGGHDAPICSIFWIKEKGCLMTLGFDNLVRLWDISSNRNSHQMQYQLGLKTHTASFDYPFLLIGSAESTVAIVNLKNLPNARFPKQVNDYLKINLQKFSKFNCSRILAEGFKIALGTVDGRCVTASFKQTYDNFSVDPMVSRSQKRTDSRTTLFGQVNCVDIGYHSYETFCLIGGSDDLSSYNTNKRSKGNTYSNTSTSIGATTAVRLSPRLEYIVYANGTDWTKGIHELENLKKPRITVVRLSTSELKELTLK